MTNTLVSPAELLEFGQYSDVHVDAAARSLRRECGWHIAPRVTEDVKLVLRSGTGDELYLPTRDFPDAEVIVNTVRNSAGELLTGWEHAEGVIVRRGGVFRYALWTGRYVTVNITHGFATCPADLLPLLAARAAAAKAPRESRVTSFTNGAIQMAFGDATMIDPTVSDYAIIGGVA